MQTESGFGSQLQLTDIKTNPSRYTTSKLMLNANIGKLGKKEIV